MGYFIVIILGGKMILKVLEIFITIIITLLGSFFIVTLIKEIIKNFFLKQPIEEKMKRIFEKQKN